jgi:LysR family hydrogen peroxide-inducible transcriptional activator
MLFSLTQLEYLIAVDRHHSFSKAAKNCFVTQPTLSMQIHKMEDMLGVILFDRSKQPIIPTDIGIKIIEQSKTILKESEKIEAMILEGQNEIAGTFHLGIIPTIAPYLLPYFLKKFQEKYPKVYLQIDELQTSQIIQFLKTDQIDGGILATPLEEKGIFEEPLYYEPFYAYLPPQHPLENRESLSVTDLPINDLLLLEEGHCFRDQALQVCNLRKTELNPQKTTFGTGNMEVLRTLVDQGFGVTLLPELMVYNNHTLLKKQSICAFQNPIPSREVSLIFSRDVAKQAIIHALKQTILEVLPKNLLEKQGKQILPIY